MFDPREPMSEQPGETASSTERPEYQRMAGDGPQYAASPYAPPPVRRGPSVAKVAVVAVLFGLMGGFGGVIGALWANQHKYIDLAKLTGAEAGSAIPIVATTEPINPEGKGPFAKVAAALDGSVVNINTTARRQDPNAWFFGGDATQEVQGLGTGMVVSDDGYILTNYHVVAGAQHVDVTVGKKTYQAKLVGGDRREDLAVIKIDATGLKPVKFGDSSKLLPGEWVMAMGNPYGFDHTVSVGVVSALHRPLQVESGTTMKDMIQTDASINPGNSGGPLINLQGEIIGINTAIYVGRGGGQPQANGIGFAIPSNHAVEVMQAIREKRTIAHPYIGIAQVELSDQVRREKRIPAKQGVIADSVSQGSPADKAGIQPDDVIVSVDGTPLTDTSTLPDYINKQGVGKEITLHVIRWDMDQFTWVEKDIKVTVGDMPDQQEQQEQQDQQGQQAPKQQQNNRQRTFPWFLPF